MTNTRRRVLIIILASFGCHLLFYILAVLHAVIMIFFPPLGLLSRLASFEFASCFLSCAFDASAYRRRGSI